MSASDELRSYLGADLDAPSTTDRAERVRWLTVCVCGHLSTAHSPTVGGEYPLAEDSEITVGGKPMHKVMAMFGCAGAMPPKGFERFTNDFTPAADGEEMGTMVSRINPTCSCVEHRPVAEVDRPHRYFNQRRPADRTDPHKHPFAVGMRAYRKRIGKLKRAQLDGPTGLGAAWADAEFDRRFRWLKSRVCGISTCTVTDDVWPVYVTDGDDRSELRCAKHR